MDKLKSSILYITVVICFFTNTSGYAASKPVYDYNCQSIINVIQRTVNVWRISPITIRGRVSSYAIYYGPQYKYTHQNKRNSVYIHLDNSNRVEYITGQSESENIIKALLSTIFSTIGVPMNELESFTNVNDSLDYFWSNKQNRRFLIYDNTSDNVFRFRIAADDGQNDERSLGNSENQNKADCIPCHGTGRCSNCNGTGKENNWVPGTKDQYITQNCYKCAGTGKCISCYGTGKQ